MAKDKEIQEESESNDDQKAVKIESNISMNENKVEVRIDKTKIEDNDAYFRRNLMK